MVEKVTADDTFEHPVAPPVPTTRERPGTGTPHTQEKQPGGGPTTEQRPTDGGGPQGEKKPTDNGGGPGQDKTDCDEIQRKINALLDALEAAHDSNLDHAKKATQAFRGRPSSKTYDGYGHWITSAKITEAVVEGENEAGKWLVDIALFAAGGWGGISAISKGSSIARSTQTGMSVMRIGESGAATMSRWHEVPAVASKLDKWLGTGIRGAKDATEVYGKIATKVLEKLGDAAAPYAGKGGSAAAKTIDKMNKEWWQGGVGFLESAIRGKVMDGLGNWMKEAASAADVERAKADYADFTAEGAAANADAAAAIGIEAAIKDLMKEAAEKNCTVPAIPNWSFFTFDLGQFGVGMFEGEKGPSLHSNDLEGTRSTSWDLFKPQSNPVSLPF